MNICTITCHDVYNYGASLQALALQSYLEKNGYNVKIIDYHPDYQNVYNFSSKVSKDSKHWDLYQKYPFLPYLKGLKDYVMSIPTRGRMKAFRRFNEQYFCLTCRYTSYKELVENPPQADMYIAGSDQIWSTKLPNGTDPAFYMKFGSPETKRISYAASFANPKVNYGYDMFVRSMLTGIDAISVRELTGVKLLQDLGFKGTQVFDPVFLLSVDEWKALFCLDISNRLFDEKYILVYDLGHRNPEMQKVAKSLSQKKGFKIIAINNKSRTAYADINLNSAGPVDFVNLIANAEYVIADSFHATAFSIIFHKPFWTYYKAENIGRMADLLSILGLTERLNAANMPEDPDWNKVQEKLEYEISRSKTFLNNQINNK